MVPSRTLVAPWLATLAHGRWRADVATALAVVAGQPTLWLIGMLGFMLRGGIAVLVLPIVVLPTQVEMRMLLGAHLGATGLTAGFWDIVAIATAVSSVALLVALYLLARLEAAAFQRLVAEPETAEQRHWQSPAETAAAPRDVAVARLFVVHAIAATGLVAAAYPLATSVSRAVFDEILRPSSGAALALRVLDSVQGPLLLLVAGVVVVELVAARAVREVLMSGSGLTRASRTTRAVVPGAFVRALLALIRAPVRTFATAALCWLLTAAAAAVIVAGLRVAWSAARAQFLATTSLAELDAGLFVVAALLSAVFVGGVLIIGFVSAVRAALWTMAALR